MKGYVFSFSSYYLQHAIMVVQVSYLPFVVILCVAQFALLFLSLFVVRGVLCVISSLLP
jgi:hypothetical protein